MAIESLADIVRHHGAEQPDKTALVFEGRRLTYGELDERSSRVAQGLKALGVEPQQRVAYLGKNSSAFFDLYFGAVKLNAVAVPVNWRLAPAEMGFILDDAESRVLLVTPEFLPHLDKLEREIPTLTTVLR